MILLHQLQKILLHQLQKILLHQLQKILAICFKIEIRSRLVTFAGVEVESVPANIFWNYKLMPNSASANQTTVSIKTEWQNGTTGKVLTTQTFNKLAVSVVKTEYPDGEIKTALYKDNTKLIEISNKTSEQHSIFGKTDPLEAELEALNNIGLASVSGTASNSGGNAAASEYQPPPRASNSVPIANLSIANLIEGIAIPAASATVKSVSIYNNTNGIIWVRHGSEPISSTFENAYYPIRPGGNSEYNAALGHWMGEIQINGQNVTNGWFTVVRES